jgi:hypothetical protein
MYQRIMPLLAGLWLAILPSTSAQVGFSLPVVNDVDPGTNIILPLTVSNFDSIGGIQFVIQWDTQVLTLINVINYNLPGMSNEDFGLLDAPNGILRFAWESPFINSGVTVADSTAIFRLRFRAVGNNNQGSSIIFTEIPPTEFEVVKAGYPPFGINDCTLENGYVAIGFSVSTNWVQGRNTLPLTISPNPFSTMTTATFDLDTAADVYMVLTDASGHPVLDKKMSLPAGRHGTEIASDQLRENGIYYLILRTNTHLCIRPLVKL